MRYSLLSILLALLTTLTVFGQDSLKTTPFSSIRIAMGGHSAPLVHGLNGWTPGYGVRAHGTTPFHWGDLEAAASWLPWSANEAGLPDFYAVQISGAWSVSSSPLNAVRPTSGIALSNYFMVFDSEQVSGERKESEFVFSTFLRLRRQIFGSVQGFIQADAARVFTNPPFSMIQLTAGLSIKMESPAWIGHILR
mgnify:FL=1